MFFKPKPNVADGEKARIEYHLQQIADAIGMPRMRLPVLPYAKFDRWIDSKSPQEMIGLLGEHLSCDTGGIGFRLDPQQLEQCGGGG